MSWFGDDDEDNNGDNDERASSGGGWTCSKCGKWHPAFHKSCWKCEPASRPAPPPYTPLSNPPPSAEAEDEELEGLAEELLSCLIQTHRRLTLIMVGYRKYANADPTLLTEYDKLAERCREVIKAAETKLAGAPSPGYPEGDTE